MNRFKKLKDHLIISSALAMKGVEDIMLKQKTTTSETPAVQQKQTFNLLAEALLRGEVTEEVELLRDRMYFVSEESKKKDMLNAESIVDRGSGRILVDITTTNEGETKRSDKIKKIKINNSGKPIVYEDGITNLILSMREKLFTEGIVDEEKKLIQLEWGFTPKYKIEKYITNISVREDNEKNKIVDVYIPMAFDKTSNVESFLVNELKRLKEKLCGPTSFLFDTISFITEDAYGCEDLNLFEYKTISFNSINTFKDKYVLSYNVSPVIEREKVTDKYIKPELREKYAKKEKKNVKLTAVFEKL